MLIPLLSEVNVLAATIEIGGTNTRLALVNEQGKIAAREQWKINIGEEPQQAIERITGVIWWMAEKIQQPRDAIVGFGISIAGEVDAAQGYLYDSVNIGWREVPLTKLFSAIADKPAILEMDAHASAIGEYQFSSGENVRHMALVFIGTGIGVGLILNGQLYRGHGGVSGEFGHVTIALDGPLCKCGRYGCLEALASGWAISEAGQAAVKRGEKTALVGSPFIDASIIFQAARQGDVVAENIVLRAAQALGIGLTNLIHSISPELIVLTGGVALNAGSLWLSTALDEMERQLGYWARRVPRRVLISRLGDQCGLLGIAHRVFEEYQRGKLPR
jgi:glucokinase